MAALPPREPRPPRKRVGPNEENRNLVIEVYELVASETKEIAIKQFLFLRQAAKQREQTDALGALVQPMSQLREILKYL